MIIDTHCHLASAQFDQSRRETYVQHALREGIDRMITLGARMDDWEANTAWARQFPGAVFVRWASIRTMPMTPRQTGRTSFSGRRRTFPWPPSGKRAWITSTGRPKAGETEQFHRLQQDLLERHFDLAERLGLNIVLHTRDRKGSASFEDALAIARNYAGRVRPVFHCFIGNTAQAMRIFDELDGMVSFTGVATFKNAPVVAETASWCPENRIMLETDSPISARNPSGAA